MCFIFLCLYLETIFPSNSMSVPSLRDRENVLSCSLARSPLMASSSSAPGRGSLSSHFAHTHYASSSGDGSGAVPVLASTPVPLSVEADAAASRIDRQQLLAVLARAARLARAPRAVRHAVCLPALDGRELDADALVLDRVLFTRGFGNTAYAGVTARGAPVKSFRRARAKRRRAAAVHAKETITTTHEEEEDAESTRALPVTRRRLEQLADKLGMAMQCWFVPARVHGYVILAILHQSLSAFCFVFFQCGHLRHECMSFAR